MKGHPEILRSCASRSAPRGSRKEETQQRADAVRDFLVGKGVDAGPADAGRRWARGAVARRLHHRQHARRQTAPAAAGTPPAPAASPPSERAEVPAAAPTPPPAAAPAPTPPQPNRLPTPAAAAPADACPHRQA